MLKGAFKLGKRLILYNLYYRYLKRTFIFNGKKYKYFYHPYNATWENERKIEVPIIYDLLKQNQGKRILEVGRVLPHYFSISHDVLDKYEKGKTGSAWRHFMRKALELYPSKNFNVINEDAVNFTPSEKYDLIISMSTLEHVGWDETSEEPEKAVRAIENLKNCLNPGGELVFTVEAEGGAYLHDVLRREMSSPSEKKMFDEIILFKEIIIGKIKA